MWKGNGCLVSVKWASKEQVFDKWVSKGELGAKKGKGEGKVALHDNETDVQMDDADLLNPSPGAPQLLLLAPVSTWALYQVTQAQPSHDMYSRVSLPNTTQAHID